ncbi:MAG TPA: hypothetical protein VMM36_08130 [Opitutaceae bacterium]|nr:hypothetical protein [Opitutaceae bacterium]
MNFADIENAWQSPHNRPSQAQIEMMKNEFATDLRRRRRGLWIFLSIVFASLTVITVLAAINVVTPGPAERRIDVSREWGAILFLTVPWVAVIFLARRALRHGREHADPSASIAASVRASLDENAMSQTRVKTAAILHGVILLLLPLVVWQLRAVGKAGDEILVPAFVLWPLLAVGMLFGMYWHYTRKLLPRKRALEELLKSYE